MAVSVTEVGIQQIDDFALLYECDVEAVLQETEPVLESDGTLHEHAADAFNLALDISLKGKGDLPVGLALATDGGFTHEAIDGGVTLVTRVKTGEYEGRHNEWEVGARNRPSAGPEAAPSSV